jgi:L-fucose mutarotase
MLKIIPPLITPDLLHSMALMGHGDQLAIVDNNYPAASRHQRVHTLFGNTTLDATRAIMTLLPLDDFVEPATLRMVPDGDPTFWSPSHEDFEVELTRLEGRNINAEPLERTKFYDLALKAFAVVHTSDPQPFSCFLITKGVVLLDEESTAASGHIMSNPNE